ncbi:WXG100 family type VII secretion target [Streptomyces sp. BBFR51]|uniref:WXG100 family type VII secretion target n=1 Tax=Streptomyces sp. BBFR51 TaxID=3372856 RepID=UPI0037DD5560
MSFTDGEIYVSYDHMQNAADDMVHQTKAIKQTIVDLDAELQALKATWSGADKDMYEHKQQEWVRAVDAMTALLHDHAGLLTQVSENYKYTERSLDQMWSEVKVVG